MTGKLFEYLGARRPILCLGYNEGSIAKILSETGAGIILNDSKDIEEFLVSCLGQYVRNDTTLGFRMDSSGTSKYSRKETARKLGRILSMVGEKNRTLY